jgi:peptidoglycan/LPS O-acetylase OafA/YrhL
MSATADAPDVVAPPPGHPRFPLLDGLRAIAALGVIASHAGYFSGASQDAWYGPIVANGTAGVTLFFVLSGFLLYRPFLAADLDGAPRSRLRDYARRRVLRIVPAYWLALTVLAIYPGLLGVFTGDWWRYYGLLQVYGSGQTAVKGLAAAWSLCIEISFYALLPLYAVAMRRAGRRWGRRRRLRAEFAVLGLLAAASVATRAISLASGGSFLELTLAGTFAWFAAGMALAALSVGPAPARLEGFVRRRPGLLWLGAAVAYGVLCLMLRVPRGEPLRYTQEQWLVQHVLVLVPAVLLVAPAVWDGGTGLPRRILRLRAVAWLGLVSYGLYLWQGGVVLELWRRGARDWVPGAPFIVMALATLAGSAACAALSYYVLERPLMRWKRPSARPAATPGTAGAAASARALAPDSGPGPPR